jgi:predicted kinase
MENLLKLMSKKPKLILLVGISGSGKSTWVRLHADPNAIVVSYDMLRFEINGNVDDHPNSSKIHLIALSRIVKGLCDGKDVILDATNVYSKGRRELLAEIREMADVDFVACAKIFPANPELSKLRIENDIKAGLNRSNVPVEAINRQYQMFCENTHKLERDGYKIIVV